MAAPGAHHDFLLGAGALLGGLALAGLLFRRFGQSVIPAFILLGMAVRPLRVDAEMVDVLATVGVVLLLFFMGLEFSLGALIRGRNQIVRAGAVDLALCFPPGVAAGLLAGWGWTGGLALGGALYVSSSAIIAQGSMEMRRGANPETEAALGVLVFEDLAVALLLAGLSAAAGGEAGEGPGAHEVLKRGVIAFGFFAVVVLAALKGRRLLDRVLAVESDDMMVLLVGAVVLLLAWAALASGLSEAIGAFLAGLAIAETRHKERIERLFAPLQGVFAALFFMAFGLSLDPAAFRGAWPLAITLALVALATKVAAGWLVGRRQGLSKRAALALGLTLTPRGEFSVLLAGVAAAAGLARASATIGLTVLILSLAGTACLRFAPDVARRAFPRKARRPLEIPGDPPPPA